MNITERTVFPQGTQYIYAARRTELAAEPADNGLACAELAVGITNVPGAPDPKDLGQGTG